MFSLADVCLYLSKDNGGPAAMGISFAWMFAMGIAIWRAVQRDHRHTEAIIVVTLFLGWYYFVLVGVHVWCMFLPFPQEMPEPLPKNEKTPSHE